MAFNCIVGDNCPKDNDVDNGGCPCWWEMPWENQETGEIKFRKGCILSQEMALPIVQSIVRAAHTASEHSSAARNSYEYGLQKLSHSLTRAVREVKQIYSLEE